MIPFHLPWKRLLPVCLALALLPAAALANLTTERFWLQNTVTRDVFGPVVRQTGYRFQAGGEGFVVLDSVPGRIRVATYPAGDPFGPYEIADGRIIDLGTYAFSILNVQPVEVPDLPPDLSGLTGLHVKGDPVRRQEPAAQHLVRRDLPVEDWPLRVGGWLEPTRKAKYDWTVGGFAGEKALDLKTTRIGARAEWGNAFLQLGLTVDGEQSGSLTPAMTSLDHLYITGGSGMGLSGGWLQPFMVDGNWDLLAGAFFEWTSESYDLTAQALVRTEKTPDPAGPVVTEDGVVVAPAAPAATTVSYEYRDISSGLDLSEFILGAVAGIEYHDGFWGARAMLRMDLLSDVSTSGSVVVNETPLSIAGERSHPLVVEFGGWCYVLDQVRADLSLQFGSIQAIRLGAYWEF